ncbi:glycoside hydrolase family 18 [uncultured Alistipes sp.]|jgi:endo-beta-N-acetylglucosaminidase F2|uniref:glycoside hydrolase family 18 n=1 Tax=uncultured Alistipes sp. TaxID=538949 RepID=UPI0025DAAB07|nr:glycoside hydrolase family 18 [uncultured Alistipes sp.]
MKKYIMIIAGLFMLFCGAPACSDWTDTEPKKLVKEDGHDAAYYANLRKWKAETKHDMAFGWYGFWSGSGTSLANSMIGVPDSVHMLAVWGPWLPSTLTPAKKKDLEYVQKVKGTVVFCTSITGWVGVDISPDRLDFEAREKQWGWKKEWNTEDTWNSDDPDVRKLQEASIRKYAQALKDSILLAGYEGFDIDFEPKSGGIGCQQELSDPDNFIVFVDELSNYFGPESNTGRLLIIDGELGNMPGEVTPYFDYFIDQSYRVTSVSGLNSKFATFMRVCEGHLEPEVAASRYLTTVNFESYSPTGGDVAIMGDDPFTGIPEAKCQLEGFARWQPTYQGVEYKKGGFGAYHIEMEYTVSGKERFYPWTREALNVVHPPKFNE